jgi:hypothetical protein
MLDSKITIVTKHGNGIYRSLIKILENAQIPYEIYSPADGRVKFEFIHTWIEDIDPITETIIGAIASTDDIYFFLREGANLSDMEAHGDIAELGITVNVEVNL